MGNEKVYDLTNPDVKARFDIIQEVEASEKLEGYKPLHQIGGEIYELQKKWVRGEIDMDKWRELVNELHGVKQ